MEEILKDMVVSITLSGVVIGSGIAAFAVAIAGLLFLARPFWSWRELVDNPTLLTPAIFIAGFAGCVAGKAVWIAIV